MSPAEERKTVKTEAMPIPTGLEIVQLVAEKWHLSLQTALMLIDNLDTQRLSMLVETRMEADRLRAQAKRIRELAERSDNRTERNREIKDAMDLEARAKELEQAS